MGGNHHHSFLRWTSEITILENSNFEVFSTLKRWGWGVGGGCTRGRKPPSLFFNLSGFLHRRKWIYLHSFHLASFPTSDTEWGDLDKENKVWG